MKEYKMSLLEIAKKCTAIVLAGALLLGPSQLLKEENTFLTVSAAEQSNGLEAVEITGKFGVNLYMDDKRFIPTDVNGYEVYPFIVDGTTYVPLRAISNLFEADIKWDDNTKSIYITKKGSKAKLDHVLKERSISYQASCVAYKGAKLYIDNQLYVPTDVNGNEKDIYIINGTTYVPLRAISNAFGVDINWSGEYNSVYLGKHKTTGLTVDNVTDATFVDKCGRDFLDFGGAFDITYEFEGERYSLGRERKNDPYYPPCYLLLLANYEYCTDEVLTTLLKDCDEFNYSKMYHFFQHVPTAIMDFYKFNWDEYVIDEVSRVGLSKMQEECAAAVRTGDYTKIVDFMLEYFEGDGEFRFQNTTPFTDMVMCGVNTRIRRASGTTKYDSDYVYYHNVEARNVLEKQIEELKDRVNQNKKVLVK